MCVTVAVFIGKNVGVKVGLLTATSFSHADIASATTQMKRVDITNLLTLPSRFSVSPLNVGE